MHTVELVKEAIRLAGHAGYRVRQEWMGGQAGGACELAGQKWLFLDLALAPGDQLQVLADALRGDPAVLSRPVSHDLRQLLAVRKSA